MDILHRANDIQRHPLGHIFCLNVFLLQRMFAKRFRWLNSIDLHRPKGQGIQAKPAETFTTRLDTDKELYK